MNEIQEQKSYKYNFILYRFIWLKKFFKNTCQSREWLLEQASKLFYFTINSICFNLF